MEKDFPSAEEPTSSDPSNLEFIISPEQNSPNSLEQVPTLDSSILLDSSDMAAASSPDSSKNAGDREEAEVTTAAYLIDKIRRSKRQRGAAITGTH